MLIFIGGKDTFRSQQKLRELTDAYTQKKNTLIITLDGENFSLATFKNHLHTRGLFNEEKLIIIKDLIAEQKFSETDALQPLLQAMPDSINVIFYERGEPNKKLQLVQYLASPRPKSSTHSFFEYPLLNEQELSRWVQTELNEAHKTIDRNASAYIAAACANSWQAHGELQKLISLSANHITKEIAETLLPPKIDDNIFHFIDALGARNPAQALSLLEEQFKNGADTFYILTMIARQIKILIKIKSALESTLPPHFIAERINEHPFVVKKALPAAKRFSYEELLALSGDILEIDKKLKTTSLPPDVLLTQVVCDVVFSYNARRTTKYAPFTGSGRQTYY